MTNVKDKLSASVRQARAAQSPAAADVTAGETAPAQPAAEKATAAKPAATRTAAARGTAAKPAASRPEARKPATPKPVPAAASGNSVRDSAGELFPARVWPD